jgi:hypothetical protein
LAKKLLQAGRNAQGLLTHIGGCYFAEFEEYGSDPVMARAAAALDNAAHDAADELNRVCGALAEVPGLYEEGDGSGRDRCAKSTGQQLTSADDGN